MRTPRYRTAPRAPAAVMIARWLAVLTVAAASGCAGGGGATRAGGGAPGSCASYPGAKSCYHVTVTASGAQAFDGTDTVPNQQACQAILARDAGGDGGEVQLSVPVFLSGPTAAFSAFLDRYHGPGTYSTAASDAGVQFVIGTTEYDPAGPDSAVSAATDAAGSVSVTFTKLVSAADPSRTISGRATFTCQDA